MPAPDRPRDPFADGQRHLLPRLVVHALRGSASAPDMTRAIMGRLGFMHAAPQVIRRARIRRRIGRLAISLAMAAMVLTSAFLHQRSQHVRRPDGPTLPAAIGNDLNHHQHRLQNMIRTIRNLTPTVETRPDLEVGPGEPPKLEPDVDHSAIAQVRWV